MNLDEVEVFDKINIFHPWFSEAKFSMVVDVSFADFYVKKILHVLIWSIIWKHRHFVLMSLSK